MKFIALCLILFYYISHSILFSSIIILHSIATDLLYYIAWYTVVYFAFIGFNVLYEVFFPMCRFLMVQISF